MKLILKNKALKNVEMWRVYQNICLVIGLVDAKSCGTDHIVKTLKIKCLNLYVLLGYVKYCFSW